MYEGARETVARHLGAEPRETIFVRNATEAINLVANSWGRANLGRGDRVLVTEMEHHSNIVPWYLIARERGAELDWAPLTDDGRLDIDAFRSLLERGTEARRGGAHLQRPRHRSIRSPRSRAWRTTRARWSWSTERRPCRRWRSTSTRSGADFYAFTGHKMLRRRRESASCTAAASCSRGCRRSSAAAR